MFLWVFIRVRIIFILNVCGVIYIYLNGIYIYIYIYNVDVDDFV